MMMLYDVLITFMTSWKKIILKLSKLVRKKNQEKIDFVDIVYEKHCFHFPHLISVPAILRLLHVMRVWPLLSDEKKNNINLSNFERYFSGKATCVKITIKCGVGIG